MTITIQATTTIATAHDLPRSAVRRPPRRQMSVDSTHFNLRDYFLGDEAHHQTGNHTAIEFRDRQITYTELRDEVDYWANQILNRGVTEGDRVALLLYDSPEFIACFLGAVWVGGIPGG